MGWNEFPRGGEKKEQKYIPLMQDIADALDMEIKIEGGDQYVYGRAKKKADLGPLHIETLLSIEHVMMCNGEVRMVVDVATNLCFYVKANEAGILLLLMDMSPVSNLTNFFKSLSKEFDNPSDLDKKMLSYGVKKFYKKSGEDKWVTKKVP